MKTLRLSAAIIIAILISGFTTVAQDDGIRIKFKAGKTSATLRGTVAKGGPDFYLLRVRAGQKLSIRVKGAVSFGVDGPEQELTTDDANITWTATVGSDGDYRIRVYSKGAIQNYTLIVSVV
ncbi:MAG TPA: hypothetical protein VLB68_09595 [Pyrinomonadaceae bacterium]|nr:hypothetical protein [Pyrinomonadaceae bacterium]